MKRSKIIEELADRIRRILVDRPEISERTMFGGVAFMLNGNMLVGPIKGGGLLARVGKDAYEDMLTRSGVRPMTFTGREMKGYVEIDDDALDTGDKLASWIAQAEQFVSTLPAK